MSKEQALLRNWVKALKRDRGITYIEIANAIGIKPASFYNFIHDPKVHLSSTKKQKLIKYLKWRKKEWEQKQMK